MDIPGSTPRKYGSLVNKVDYVNKIDDIEKSSPKQLHYKLNRPEFILHNTDIDGTLPQCVKFKSDRIPFNPLEPKYNFAKYEERSPIIPRYIRDSINIDDIDGAQPKKYFKWMTTPTTKKYEDIEGSKPRIPKIRKGNYNSFDYSDVTNFKFSSKRNINPLDPEYIVDYGRGEKFTHGLIEGSKPVSFPYIIYKKPYNLLTSDISGAQIGTRNKYNKYTSMNYNLILSDIENAQSGSLRKGIKTDRQTNPVDPIYNLPGNLEPSYNQNPYGNSLHAKAKSKSINSNLEELALKERLDKIKSNSINNVINGKNEEYKPHSKRTHINPQEIYKLESNELVGFNNQIFEKDKQTFNPEKYKRPEPYHGYVHEQYIISSDHDMLKKFEEKKKSPINIIIKDTNLKINGKVGYGAFENNINNNNNQKQTNAQKLDKFIGSI